ncbi:hypothetical protein [Hahella sp. HN01]|uniref:hypothetical protein n=1 Tax=Hahella sp. HN01 TaxID=2847262 RepID=UPI001C1EF31C|nr:hypothetical protein [Hahella sp. HN01]MBU6956079.1 hypothetical protein [Hahella sp. HN01]
MISQDLKTILTLLSERRDEIEKIIRGDKGRREYFDRDSEGEGTHFPEIALLRLCFDIFSRAEGVEDEDELMLQELSWLIYMVLCYFDIGEYVFSWQSENDYVWDIARRYSLIMLKSHGRVDLSTFNFDKMLEEYGYGISFSD